MESEMPCWKGKDKVVLFSEKKQQPKAVRMRVNKNRVFWGRNSSCEER